MTGGVRIVGTKTKECAMTDDFASFQNERDILLNPDVQDKMAILMGTKKENQPELTPEQQKQITKNYIAMFFSLGVIYWCNGATLGVAWQKALEQMDSFVKTKIKVVNHPMAKYLNKLHEKHRHDTSKEIMMNPNSNMKLDLPAKVAKQWADFATKHFQENKGALNNLYQQLMPQQQMAEESKKEPFKTAQEKTLKMMQQLMLQYQIRQRSL